LTNKFSNDLPSLAPDRDQVSAYKNHRTNTDVKAPKEQKPQKQSSTFNPLIVLLIFSIMGFGAWWSYQHDIKSQALIKSAENRIAALEEQLSATGEEMGESSIAMKVRLEALSKKTEDLWIQMDKLWASAWRKNQAEIAVLNRQMATQNANLKNQTQQTKSAAITVKSIGQKLTDAEFNLGILSEQIQLIDQIKKQSDVLSNNISALESKDLERDNQQIQLAGNLAQIKSAQNKLVARIKQLESQLTNSVP
jgi:hypothetical protein